MLEQREQQSHYLLNVIMTTLGACKSMMISQLSGQISLILEKYHFCGGLNQGAVRIMVHRGIRLGANDFVIEKRVTERVERSD